MANLKSVGVRSPYGAYKIGNYPVNSSAVFAFGDFVLLGSTGLIPGHAAGGAFAAASTNATRIAGRALAPAADSTTNVQNTYVPVIVPLSDVEFNAPLYSATAANAVPTLAQIGTKYGLYQTTGNFPAVNLDDTSNTLVIVTDFDPADFPGWPAYTAPGTVQFANVWFSVLAAAALQSANR